MWFTGVEVEQETSAPPPKKILDPPLSNDNNDDDCTYLAGDEFDGRTLSMD